MRRRAVLAVVAVGLAQPANARPDALLLEKLAPEIASACTASTDGRAGSLSASALGRAIFASGYAPLVAQYDWVRTGGIGIATEAFAKPTGVNRRSLQRLRGLIGAWIAPDAPGATERLPIAAGGVEIRRSDGTALRDDAAAGVLAAILDGKDEGLNIRCLVPANGVATPLIVVAQPARKGPSIIVTRAPSDLTVADLVDRPSAELSYINDLDADRRTVSLVGTIGARWPEFALGDAERYARIGGVLARVRPLAFVQLEREGSTGDPDAIDDLAVGFQVDGFVQTRPAPRRAGRTASHYFAVNGRYLTDTRFDSRSWSLAARVTPDIRLPGNDVPYRLGDLLTFRWLVSGTVDHVSNDRPGRKADLIGAPSWTRLGFDATANLTLNLPERGRMQLRADYALRQNLGSGPGDARLLSARLLYLPDDHLSFGLAYDRGETLDGLTHKSVVKAVFGVRR